MTKKFFFGFLAFAPVTVLIMVVASIVIAGAEWREFWLRVYSIATILIAVTFMINVPFNKHVDIGKKTLWVALIFFGNIWIFPFYWWFHLRTVPNSPPVYDA